MKRVLLFEVMIVIEKQLKWLW